MALIALVNVVVFLVLVGLAEVGFGLLYDQPNVHSYHHWQRFRPFVMFANPHVPSGRFNFKDHYANKVIPSIIPNNTEGFAMAEEVSLSKRRGKGVTERVVVLTGGSAAWGVGASSYESSIAGKLESLLDAAQDRYDYTVLNLAMGGWTAFQQYIALAQWGKNLDPDWLVVMDATNDAAVACAHAQGAGYTLYYALMDAFVSGYTFLHLEPVFYRGKIENWLTEHSAIYRGITGKKPVKIDLILEDGNKNPIRRVIRDTDWSDVEQALAFYIRTEQLMVELFPDAKILLSTQPLPFDFNTMFGGIYKADLEGRRTDAEKALLERLEGIANANHGKKCGLARWNSARDYFMPLAAMKVERLTSSFRGRPKPVYYTNAGHIMPTSFEARKPFFIDPVHLNDSGMEKVAQLYSQIILASDIGSEFTMPAMVTH
jgi:hypothetical protein